MRVQFGVAVLNCNTVSDAIFMRFVLCERFSLSRQRERRACIFTSLHLFGSAKGLGNHLHFACETSNMPFHLSQVNFHLRFSTISLRMHSTSNKKKAMRKQFCPTISCQCHLIGLLREQSLGIEKNRISLQQKFHGRCFSNIGHKSVIKLVHLTEKEIRNIIITIGPNEPKENTTTIPI